MVTRLVLEFITLSLYTALIGFCFCDGFRLHIIRKLAWFGFFLSINIYVLNIKDEFDLSLILPLPTLLAILLCAYEKLRIKAKR